MALSANNVNLELIKFKRKLTWTFLRESRFDAYTGDAPTNIIQRVMDLEANGKQINVPLLDQLRGTGVSTGTLVGNEDTLDNYGMPLWADWCRNAVLFNKAIKKETAINIRDAATPALQGWARRLRRDDMVSALLSVPTAAIPAGYHVGAGQRVNGVLWSAATAGQQNNWLTANNDRILFGHLNSNTVAGNVASSLLTLAAATDKMSAAIGLLAKRKAMQTTNITNWPAIKPYQVVDTDQEWYVCFIGSRAYRDLSADPAMLNANLQARQRETDPLKTNPIFTGAHLVKDGIVYREIPEIDAYYIVGGGTVTAPTGPLAGKGAAGIDTAPCFMCGQSAYAYVLGQLPRATRRKEDDYEFLDGIGVEAQYAYGKIAKAPVGSPGTNTDLKDWGVVTFFVAATPDT
ncbi:MAG TPA: DUF4043 family protein [Thermoanaerobaculia bacterium]|nr:DUF4043 family protein [Thermoanaerobaculia bacterium]